MHKPHYLPPALMLSLYHVMFLGSTSSNNEAEDVIREQEDSAADVFSGDSSSPPHKPDVNDVMEYYDDVTVIKQEQEQEFYENVKATRM